MIINKLKDNDQDQDKNHLKINRIKLKDKN